MSHHSLKQTAFFHDELCLWHTTGMSALVFPIGGWVQPPNGAAHAESPESKRRMLSLIQVSGLMDHLAIQSAPSATREDMLRIHSTDYLDRFKTVSDAGGGDLGEQAPFGLGGFEIAAQSAGLAKQAVMDVLCGKYKNAYALSRPPGHHCEADMPKGFCLLANIPIAIEAAKQSLGLGKVLILDWDVHHGNGQQSIYYERDDVMTISMHQEGCFPFGYSGEDDTGAGKGLGYNINIPLLPGSGHDAYLYAMTRIVVPVVNRFKPDLIVVACGYDANAYDPLARMQLSSASFRAMTQQVMALADQHCQGRLVLVHEGGYSEAYVPFCGHAVVEALTGQTTSVEDPGLEPISMQQPNTRLAAFARGLIDELALGHGL
jgi:acetoin utilization deacetylase AcuC-like enzyme